MTEQQIRFLANVVSRLVVLVAKMNTEAWMDTTPNKNPPEQREKGYGDVNAELNNLRATLEAWVQRWDAEGKPPQTPPLPDRAG